MCALVLFGGCISYESYPSCACHKSERELDQIKGNPGTRLTPIPAREGENYRMGKLQFKGKEASVMFGWEEGRMR